MERNAKRILAIVIIAVIATGGIIGVWFLLSTPPTSDWETPGVTGIPESQWIKVGVIGPATEAQGIHQWQGAWLAAYDVNTNGGIDVNGTQYYFAVSKEDTHEASSSYIASQGTDAVNRLIQVKGADVLVGGFRTDNLLGYMERVMELETIMMGTGAADDVICWGQSASTGKSIKINASDPTSTEHQKYKYYFQVGPHISTFQGADIITAILEVALGPAIGYTPDTSAWASAALHQAMYLNGTAPEYAAYETATPGMLTNIRIFREDLSWSVSLARAIEDNAPFPVSWVNISATADVATYDAAWDDVIDDEVQMVIPIISFESSISMMKSYANKQPKTLVMGIDVEAQTSEFAEATDEKCNFEIFSAAASGLDMATAENTHAFYEDFVAKWGHVPLYTGSHSYDAIMLLNYTIDRIQSLDTDDIITGLETNGPLTDVIVASKHYMFMETHDPMPTYIANSIGLGTGWFETAFGQWQDGEQVPLPTGTYTPTLANGNFIHLPTWGIYGITTA